MGVGQAALTGLPDQLATVLDLVKLGGNGQRNGRAFGSAALEYPVRLVVNDYGTIFLSTYLSSDPFTIDGSTFMPNSGIVSSLVLRFDPAGVAPAP